MNTRFLKSTTAIVLSLSLTLPPVAMAQTAAELEAELGGDTSNMSEEELDELRAELAERQSEAAEQGQAQQAEASDQAGNQEEVEEEGLLDRAVGAMTDGINDLTGADEDEDAAEAPADESEDTAAAPAAQTEGAAEAPAAGADAEAQTAQAEAEAEATVGDAPEMAEETPPADAAADPAQENAAASEAAQHDEPASHTAEATDAAEGAIDADTAADATDAPAGDADATTTAGADASATGTADGETAEAAEEAAEGERTEETEVANPAPAGSPDEEGTANETAETSEEASELERTVEGLRQDVEQLTADNEELAERQAEAEARAAEAQSAAMAAAAEGTEGAELVENEVTEDSARASTEEFQTDVDAPQANTGATATTTANTSDSEGLSAAGKIALFGLGALAVNEILKNGSEVVSNSGDRVVVQQPDGSYKVYRNDDVLMFQPGTDVKTYAYDDGSTRTVATRDDGVTIETIRAADGTVLRRTRILPDGQEVVLFDDTRDSQEVEVNELPQVTDTRNRIDFQSAQEDELRAALQARAPEAVDRRFSLSQVRNINAVRQLVPEIDVDNINFETGSAVIRPAEAEELARLGQLMRERIEENPGEIFLIEGHTDAVGSGSYNLALSDRRAESVALALTEYFDVPPENMVIQGYGETDLKVRTADAERANRRAAVRRITGLLSGS
ncbi:Outer membrane protein, OmpA/MotB family protein [Pseudooceanicola batsensis HTCC2597]|uniref:Outer membrane protein, OmpA/MotB family protein n=1 Tax=Pseudooceanicola batsensis (strain ATCC BAA-863 / DSM 15984 / KCTC 12145 / HTCC2597) TaxID=252305 RepID=A3U1T1_PSEBH|nr:OmpA family protein [Pseudooceanicola batsensis]EAQ01865.1 Outer membrane protein, OmpA/MotB family protein [Pseudooceanicola batsensis HTCC2597]